MRPIVLVCCIACAAHAQEAGLRAVLPQLGADDYRTREAAERRLETIVREGGQAAFDILESKILPDVRAGPDAEITLRVERVIRLLGTSRLLWCRQLDVSLMCPPKIAAREGVVVRTGSSGLDVLDARTGALRWSLAGWFEKPLPGIAGGIVYLNRPPDAVAAFGATDGRPLWVHEVADIGGDSGRTHVVGVHRNGTYAKETRPLPPAEWKDRYVTTLHVPEWNRTVVATAGGSIAALDADGRRIWCVGKVGRLGIAPALGLIFATGNEDGPKLLALEAETGKTRWSIALEGLAGIAAAVPSGTLLVAAQPLADGRIEGRLHALDARTGTLLWTFRPPVPTVDDVPKGTVEATQHGSTTVRRGTISHPGDETRMWGAFAAAGGEIVVTSVPALRFGLRASDGKLLWKVPRQGIRLADVQKDGLVWGVSERGEVVAVDPRDGSVVRAIELLKLEAAEDAPKLMVQRDGLPPAEELGDLSAPVFDGDVCYVTAASGWTIALRIPPFRSRAGK